MVVIRAVKARDPGGRLPAISRTTAWIAQGVAGIQEEVHPGAARRFNVAGEAALVALVQSGPRSMRLSAGG